MQVDIKYYKYTDPISGELQKDVGIITSRVEVKSKKKVEADNSLTTISEEKVHIVTERKPVVANAQILEITKAEFDALPESALVSVRQVEKLTTFKNYMNDGAGRVSKPKETATEVISRIKVITDTEAAALEQQVIKSK